MCPLTVRQFSCALVAPALLASAAFAQPITHDGVHYVPLSTGTSLQVIPVAGDPYIVARTIGTATNPDLRATPLSPFSGFSSGVIPWMLPTAPPDGSRVEFSAEGRRSATDSLRLLAQISHIKEPGGDRIHFGTDIPRADIARYEVEYRLTGQPVYAEFRDPCETFGPGVVPQRLCDWIVSAYCYATLAPGCNCVFNPGECDNYQVGATLTDHLVTSWVHLGRAIPLSSPGAPVFTADEIVVRITLASSANSYQLSSARFRSAGPGFNGIALRDMTVIPVPPPPRCPCDWNNSNSVDSQDFFDYLRDFFSGRGDINNDSETTSQDFFEFLRCFFNPADAGC